MNIRPAIFPHDYAAIADVLKAESPDWAATAEELAYEDAARDPRYHHATFVAETVDADAPVIVGVAFVGRDTRSHREGKFLMNLRVRPDWQGRGVGKALYQVVLEHLAPQELCADVWEAHPRTARFLAERGFVEVWRRTDFVLDATAFDAAPYTGLEEHLQQMGIVVKTYAELCDMPNRVEKLHGLDGALWQDVPYFGQAPARRSLAQFIAEEIDHPRFLPDACFIALYGTAFAGYSNLSACDEGFSIEMTGVLREYRGKGVAILLKVYGIRYTLTHGGRLWTVNDSANRAIVALNEKLGFQRNGAIVRFAKLDANGIK